LEVHGERMLEASYDPGFRIELHRKDLAIALQLAREEGVPLLATAQVAELLNALIAQGAGGQDHSAIATLYERLSPAADPAPA
ncbi:MAG: NAD-binding protein, partial [Actinomycetota bacterium]|nr:NAD-binding protein [Actinomycetota bacterium]